MSNYQMPFSIISDREIERSRRSLVLLQSRSPLSTNNNPLKIPLTLKFGGSATVPIRDSAFQTGPFPSTVSSAIRRNDDIDGKI